MLILYLLACVKYFKARIIYQNLGRAIRVSTRVHHQYQLRPAAWKGKKM